MKIAAKTLPVPPSFQPVELKLTFQTQEELTAFARLFNSSRFCDAMREASGLNEDFVFYRELQQAGADVTGVTIIEDIIERHFRY